MQAEIRCAAEGDENAGVWVGNVKCGTPKALGQPSVGRISTVSGTRREARSGHYLLVGGLMVELASDRPAASIIWPESKAASQRVPTNTSTGLILGEHVYSGKTSGELVWLEAATGRQFLQNNEVTSLKNGDSVLMFTGQGSLIRAQIRSDGYRELGRAHLIDPTYAFNGRNVNWTPPAYAERRVFVRGDKELICASPEAEH